MKTFSALVSELCRSIERYIRTKRMRTLGKDNSHYGNDYQLVGNLTCERLIRYPFLFAFLLGMWLGYCFNDW